MLFWEAKASTSPEVSPSVMETDAFERLLLSTSTSVIVVSMGAAALFSV